MNPQVLPQRVAPPARARSCTGRRPAVHRPVSVVALLSELLLALSACFGTGDIGGITEPPSPYVMVMTELNASGARGVIDVTSAGDTAWVVYSDLFGVANGASYDRHLHRGASCAELGPVVIDLGPETAFIAVTSPDPKIIVNALVPDSLARPGTFVDVHTLEGTAIACGEFPPVVRG